MACASWRIPEQRPGAAQTTPAVPQVNLHRPSGAPSCPARGTGRTPSIWHLLAAAVTAPVCLESACPAPWPHTSVFGARSVLCLKPQSFLNPAGCPTSHPRLLGMDLPPPLPWISSLLLPRHRQYLLSTHPSLLLSQSQLQYPQFSLCSLPAPQHVHRAAAWPWLVLPQEGGTALGQPTRHISVLGSVQDTAARNDSSPDHMVRTARDIEVLPLDPRRRFCQSPSPVLASLWRVGHFKMPPLISLILILVLILTSGLCCHAQVCF